MRRRLVVKFKVSDREAVGGEERQHSFEGRDIGRRSAKLHDMVVNKATMKSDKNVLVAKIRRDRKATSEVGGGPFRVVDGVGVAVIGGGGRSKTGRST